MVHASKNSVWQSYRYPIMLLICIAIGAIAGTIMGKDAEALKPFGDIFINMMFTVVVPLVFVNISSAVANIVDLKRLGKILGIMLAVFIITGIISATMMLVGVSIFPPAEGINLELKAPEEINQLNTADQFVQAFTVSNFSDLLSRKNMLALIVFSILFGLSVSLAGEKGRKVADGLTALSDVMIKMIKILMYYAPIGLGAYFANLVGVFGPDLLGSYARAMAIYYPISFLYFFLAFTIYAYLAVGKQGPRIFWKNAISPAVTSFATGSSVATIPVNLSATEKIGVPKDIREIVIPLGATAHMDGSCLSAILKISFIFGLFNMPFHGIDTYLTAIMIAVLSGVVMSGVPGGGFIGEMLIVTMYGFPPEALPIIAMLGTLVDPPATMVNATGDTVASMLVARIVDGKEWMKKKVMGSHSETA
ncbi:dicarboxylate/amino acid:cation symporter [Brevibacillus invocatus]|uniref:dicarboxylate/amino acid:cation symporter n=1 Tax=Brevibacillus invocatus TaxID=173959 RepID=UPI002041A2A6|nr:dicarboxylate/amino acid:cation symporter [Brevibacillus invocatus]MCM3078327.1 dicarboxylate/amino acid:cation symporter [Brevibacillus invocatus]MCM3428518.1 dicarboxylate/amino acid:cation symporter [Brevibacillus invocatus]